jgi:hypothetical protein
MLRARIDAHERRRQETQDRADVDDLACALTPHAWEHGLDHTQDAKDVGVEQCLRLADARFLDGTDQIGTGIVDENVDAASAAAHLFNAGLDRSVIADIERHELDARERTCCCGCADAAEDAVTPVGQQLGGCPADAGRCARDKDNAALSFRHGSSSLRRQDNEGCGLSQTPFQDHLLRLPLPSDAVSSAGVFRFNCAARMSSQPSVHGRALLSQSRAVVQRCYPRRAP